MSGWRDTDGRTASERRKLKRETERADFVDNARRRPLSLLKGLAGFGFVLILILALIVGLR